MDLYTPAARVIVQLPRWGSVLLFVVISIVFSIAATLSLIDHSGMSASSVRTSWLVTIFVPIVVAWPVVLFGVSLILDLEKARAEAERLANTDLLTGVLNRRRFVKVATDELQRSRASEATVTVLLLDVDDFKNVNDAFGHDAGDAVLQMVAQRCSESLRPNDAFARWGGEEFVAVLPETTDNESIEVALKLRNAISSGEVNIAGKLINVTASIGVATECMTEETLDSLINRADHAMYEAKRSGKNRAILAKRIEPDTNDIASMTQDKNAISSGLKKSA